VVVVVVVVIRLITVVYKVYCLLPPTRHMPP